MQRFRMPSKLSESVHHQLNMYALAAGTAGVAMLALSQPAEARIVYTRTNCLLGAGRGNNCVIDLDHDGIDEFRVRYYAVESGGFLTANRYDSRQGARRIMNAPGTWTVCSRGGVAAVRDGRSIRPNDFWCRSDDFMFKGGKTSQGGFFSFGPWKNATNRYLGLRFVIKGELHYGWARCHVKLNESGKIEAGVTGYAYETIPNKPIKAGRTHGRDEATLGHLATGASATPAWRVKPTAATTH